MSCSARFDSMQTQRDGADTMLYYVSRRLLHQVYRAVRNSVQDAAVKLLTNVDTAQLATFSQVSSHSLALLCSALLVLRCAVPCHTLLEQAEWHVCSHFALLTCYASRAICLAERCEASLAFWDILTFYKPC